MSPEEEKAHKRVAYYGASVNAWFQTSIELDKSLITISSALIGLLLTLSFTRGLPSVAALVLFFAALLCFICTISLILYALHGNRQHISDVLRGNNTSNGSVLTLCDRVGQLAFALGIALTMLLAISIAVESYLEKGVYRMSEKKSANNTSKQSQPTMDSVQGMANLQPQAVEKSFASMAKLQPQAQVPAVAPDTAAQPTESSSVAQQDSANPKE